MNKNSIFEWIEFKGSLQNLIVCLQFVIVSIIQKTQIRP